jgi:hypothetical protein
MEQKYNKDQLWELYNELPEELKSAIFSEKTAMNIWDICTKNGIKEDKIPDIAQMVGQVFLGLVPPEDLKKEIRKELKISQEKAKKVSQEIERFIFFSVKRSLAEMYNIDFNPEKPEEKNLPKEDKYREPIE